VVLLLQWGRRSSSTESRLGDACESSIPVLNGAVDSFVDGEEALRGPRAVASAYMGPSIIVDGEENCHWVSDLTSVASMGPSIIVDGELPPR